MTKIKMMGKELRAGVRGLVKVIPKRTNLPILSSVLVKADTNGVTLWATSLDEYAGFTLKTAECDGDACFAADIEHLKAVCGGDLAEFDVGPKSVTAGLEKNGQRLTRGFKPLDSGDFPALPPEADIRAPGKSWLEAYRDLLPFKSRDPDRLPLQGVYTDLKQNDGSATMVATDGRRMTCVEPDFKLRGVKSFITPATKFLAGIKPDENQEVRIGCTAEDNDQRWVCLECGPWRYAVRPIQAQYPNYRQVIPPEGKNSLLLSAKDDIPGLLKWLPGESDDGVVVKKFRRNGVCITAPKSPGNSAESSVRLKCSRFTGPDKAIMLRRDYLANALQSGFSQFNFADSFTPLLCRLGNATHVLMPMRMESDSMRRAA